MSEARPAVGAPTVPAGSERARLSSRSVALTCAILFALLVAAWAPLWWLAGRVVQQALEPAHLSVWLSHQPDWETTQDLAKG